MIPRLCAFIFLALDFVFGGASSAFAQRQPVDERDLRLWADRGDPDSQFELGIRLVTGEGLKKNEKEGAEWVRKAAEQNHLRAQHAMGAFYEEGIGFEKNAAKAIEWYTRSANNGFPEAQHTLGIAYDLGRGVKKDPAESAQWFRKAANQDYAPSLAAYASKLERGDGVAKNTGKAALYYLRASQRGHLPAMSRLAYMYYTGVGVPRDFRRAGAWYQRAARADDPWAKNDLAWFFSTCPDESFHNGEIAVVLAKEAVKQLAEAGADERHAMLDTVAAALARNGDFLGAVLWQKRAISLLGSDKELEDEERVKLEKEFADRLKGYQKQQPYVEEPPAAEEGTEALPGDTILQEERLPGRKKGPESPPSKSGKGSVV